MVFDSWDILFIGFMGTRIVSHAIHHGKPTNWRYNLPVQIVVEGLLFLFLFLGGMFK